MVASLGRTKYGVPGLGGYGVRSFSLPIFTDCYFSGTRR